MRRTLILCAATVALTGCGKREPLMPAAGASMPPKPAMASSAPTVDQLLTPSSQQRPGRSEELLQRSEERPDDRFDLPPPG
jgi:predicted small lipoprotein YifL